MKIRSQYYTAKEVKQKLGITQGELNTFTRNGTLKSETPPGKKQGVYKSIDVDQLARERQAFMAIPQKTSSTFSMATKEDIKATIEITRVLFGLRESAEIIEARLENSDVVCYIVKVDGEKAGYALFLPTKLEQIRKLLRHKEFTMETYAEEE